MNQALRRRLATVERSAAAERTPTRRDVAPTPQELAYRRLAGALDCAARDTLSPSSVCALAARIEGKATSDADADFLASFDRGDAEAAGITAEKLIEVQANVWNSIGPNIEPIAGDDSYAIGRSATLVRMATAVLAERLRELPSVSSLFCLGESLQLKTHTADDLVLIRALPYEWLRANAAEDHWHLFVCCRIWPC